MVCRSARIERIDNRGIRSVKCVLRFVNRISLVGLRIFHGKSCYIRFVDPYGSNGPTKGVTVCKVCFTVRKSHLISGT